MPEALISALEASNHEDAVRNAVSLGGDADTLACIAGGLSEAIFGLPAALARAARERLDPDMLDVLDRFCDRIAAA